MALKHFGWTKLMQDDTHVKGRKQTGKINQQANENRLGVPLLHTGSLLFRNGYMRHAMPCTEDRLGNSRW